jgi:O-antigen/teichoic acid export membrane protein
MSSLDWIQGRLARISPLRLVLTQLPSTITGTFFLVANALTGQTGWAIVFGILLTLQVAVVIAWVIARAERRRDARTLGEINRRAAPR